MGQKQTIVYQEMPKPGDHISSNRAGDLYYHHGIYLGDDMVIHLLPPATPSNSSLPCQKCGYTPRLHGGIVKTCLSCFRDGHQIEIVFDSVSRKPADEVMNTATEFFQRIRTSGDYNFAFNNSEDFASFCVTGTKLSRLREAAITVTPSSPFTNPHSDGLSFGLDIRGGKLQNMNLGYSFTS